MIPDTYSKSIQILGFCLFFTAFINYYSERTGLEFSHHLLKGVKMYRDSNGVPNILSDNLNDAYFALGFSHAEDRLWAMYFYQKFALGELSQFMGEKALIMDKFARVLNFRDVCKSAADLLSQEEKDFFMSYASGVNHYIESTWMLPFEFVLFNIRATQVKWNFYSSCLVEKIVEYYLTYDFFQEMMRTHLLEHFHLSKDVIEKLFPFKFEGHEYQRTIIKDEEMESLRYKRIVKTAKDIQYAVGEKDVNPGKEEGASEVNKGVGYLDLEEEEGIASNSNEIKDELGLGELLGKGKGTGSNNYVISGKLTENGHPYLGNDPHLKNAMPSLWYFANIKVVSNSNSESKSKSESESESDYHFTGATIPGVPAFFIGSNSHVAWGITNGAVDTADVIRIEKSRVDENLNIHLDDTKPPLKITKRTEVFFLNNSKQITMDFLETDFGPVINGHSESLLVALGHPHSGILNEDKYYYIMRAAFLDKKDTNMKGMINLPLSKNAKDFRSKCAYLTVSLNIVYMDKEDNIGYQLTGRIPRKYHGEEGAYIKVATRASDFYTDYIPFEELPHLINPERGYIVTSNNLVIGPDYKYYLHGSFIVDARARVLEDEIEAQVKKGKKINQHFVSKKLLGNIKDFYCKDILNLIFAILKNDNYDPQFSFGIADMKEFNCVMERDSQSALIFNVLENEIHHVLHFTEDEHMKQHTQRSVIEADERTNYLIYKLKQYINNPSVCLKEYKMSCGQFILSAYENALEYIQNALGKDVSFWKWKNLNVKHYVHKPFSFVTGLRYLAHRTVKTDGNWRTPKISLPKYYYEKSFESLVSSNFKFMTSLHDKNETYFSIDSGQNGRFFHRHYDDLQVKHEKGILVQFDKTVSDEFTLEFKKK